MSASVQWAFDDDGDDVDGGGDDGDGDDDEGNNVNDNYKDNCGNDSGLDRSLYC